MSGNVVACCQSAIAATRRSLRSIDGGEHLVLPEQRATAGRAVTVNLAGRQPSIDCAYIHAAQLSDLTLRQQLLVLSVVRQHVPSLDRHHHDILPSMADDGATATPRLDQHMRTVT